ncbi:MAG: O-antigen ligase family protein [Candidatus Pacebacteria bacterium]|nr:O-antigen ligase family protein [Candidatus Paceibacterota bacterium]
MESEKIEKLFYLFVLLSTYFLAFIPFVIVPLYFPFTVPKYLYIIALTEIVIFTSLCLYLLKNPKFLRISPLMLILGGFVFITLLASILGINPILSFFGKFDRSTNVILLLHLFLFSFFASFIFKKNFWQEFFLLSVIVGVSISFILIGSHLGLVDEYNIKTGVTFGNSSFLATYLLFILFFSLYFLLENELSEKILVFEKKETKFIGFLGFAISSIGLYLSMGRAATLSSLAGLSLIFLLYFAFEVDKKAIKELGKIALGFFFLFFFLFLIFFHWPDSFVQKFFYPQTTKARFVVWQGSFEAAKIRPILGYGQETFELVYLKHLDPVLFSPEGGQEVRFDKAHNIIFETLISSGILGLLFYLLIFIYAFWFLFKNYFQKKIGFALMSCFCALLFAYFLQNLTVFDTPTSYFLFFLVLGFLASIDQKVKWRDAKITSFKKILILFLFFAFLFAFYYLFIKPAKATYFMAYLLQQNLPSRERMERFKEIEKGLLFGKFQAREAYALKAKSEYEKGKATEKEMEFAAKLLKKNIKEVPDDYYSMLFLGQLYNVWGKRDKEKLKLAEEILKKAIDLSPKNLYAYWHLIETKRKEGDLKGALNLAKLVLAIQPRDPYSQKLYSEILEEIKLKNLKN